MLENNLMTKYLLILNHASYFSGEAVTLAKHLYALEKENKLSFDTSSILWLIGSLGLDLRNGDTAAKDQNEHRNKMARHRWKSVFTGGLFVEPHMPELAEFKTYFLDTLKVN